MIRRVSPLLLLVAAAGCKPTNAELVEGRFKAFLSHETSLTVARGNADLDATPEAYTVDCRRLEEGQEKLDGALDICGDDLWPPVHESWLDRDAYHIQGEDLVPWRGEAIMTSEGDLQLTFHHRVTGGDDMRFAFVVDPAFQPITCEQQPGGGVGWELVDDGEWLVSWSDGAFTSMERVCLSEGDEFECIEPGTEQIDGTLFLLNAGSYQFNPAELADVWPMPLEWRAGFAEAKFGEEKFTMRTTRYGEPSFYASYESEEAAEPARDDLFYVTLEEGIDAASDPAFADLCNRVLEIANETQEELDLVQTELRPVVHCNGWRPTDGRPSGLDAWVELHYNWVRIDQDPSTIEVGAPVSGEFSLVFDGEQTQSRLLVTGQFEVEKIRRDRWVTDDVNAIKLEENETELCGETYGADD